jgi:hypothetical protein
MKHSFPYLFPIKDGAKNDLPDRKTPATMPLCPDKIPANDRRAVTVNKNCTVTGIEVILAGLLILELIRTPPLQESNLVASSKKLIEERPHLKNNRYYKAWRRRELMKNAPGL